MKCFVCEKDYAPEEYIEYFGEKCQKIFCKICGENGNFKKKREEVTKKFYEEYKCFWLLPPHCYDAITDEILLDYYYLRFGEYKKYKDFFHRMYQLQQKEKL